MKPLTLRFLLLLVLTAFLGLPGRGANPPPGVPNVSLRDFQLTGDLGNGRAEFTLTAIAHVEERSGGSLELLAGTVALTELGEHPRWQLRADTNRFVAEFERNGDYPIRLKFRAAILRQDRWNAVAFRVASTAVQPVLLYGLAADTQFQFAGAARPERKGPDFVSFLPADGSVSLSWTEARPEAEGKLFYAAEMWSQISLGPGLMRQVALLDFKVMQGELSRVTLLLHGAGEVTRVQGDQVLAWQVEPIANSPDRRLVVQMNQAQKDTFTLLVQTQTPLGAFPQVADSVQLRPESATRFAGYIRIVNEGAVRLEVVQASGLSQISPDQFPETDATRANLRAGGTQRFAYRFSGGDFGLRIQADQILPELAVSEVLAYHLAESELAIDAEIELDIREAPLRELLLRVPKGYALARLTASGLSDYFLREPAEQPDAELRLVYGQPVTGRQVIQLRLEHNQPLGATNWVLPRLEVPKAKSVRGNLAISSDPGFRLTPERTVSLTEIATAFFPRKVAGIQSAFRLAEPAWEATLRVERLPKTVQADAFHLFSIGEGIAYGSSVINYVISGAPVSALRVELSEEYFNVEFTGKDIRNWQKTDGGFLVQLHTPVAGPYTLLATYERPFKSQGETLTFTGARPLDAQAEQGHTLVISAYQFQVKPVEISPGLLPLETGEVPPEYRLFFDAPILAAYHYTSRPFNLKLALSPLQQGDSLSQVVDRATLSTRISKEGQVLTDVRYFVKNRGNPHFRLTLPPGAELWSATVNGASVVPVLDGTANLIPLPQRADPNAVLQLDLKVAAKSASAGLVAITAPIVGAPVMLEEWRLAPDEGQRLEFRGGTLTPLGHRPDVSGFAALTALVHGPEAGRAGTLLAAGFALLLIATGVWWWTARPGVYKYSARFFCGGLLGLVAFGLALWILAGLASLAVVGPEALTAAIPPREITLLAPVQQAGAVLNVEVRNVSEKASPHPGAGLVWPLAVALAGGIGLALLLRRLLPVYAWLVLAWLALRWTDGAGLFFLVFAAFLVIHLLIPAVRRLLRQPVRPRSTPPTAAPGGATAAAALVVLAALVSLGGGGQLRASEPPPVKTVKVVAAPVPLAEWISQEIRVEDKFAFATAKIRWQASKDQRLHLLTGSAVLTHVDYPTRALRLLPALPGNVPGEELLAESSGKYEITLQYQMAVTKRGDESGFSLPTVYGLINELKLTLVNLEVEVQSPQAVSSQGQITGSNTVATLVLAPQPDAWIGWKPRRRDVQREKSVFYAEFQQLYVPSAGVIEGAHWVSIRPAQGELTELIFDIPAGATITDVLEAPGANAQSGPQRSAGALISLWRFDPDSRKLRVSLKPAQSRPFALLIRSQVPTGPLPINQSVGLVAVEGAAGQIALLGIATGGEVQLDAVTADAFSPVNLEDFPTTVPQALAGRLPGLAVRRAFRSADVRGSVTIKASAVEPDVRVETQDTLSLSEDRTVLAANFTAEITRAGIFSLSFFLPTGFDVESVSGAALSHWTELKAPAGRLITLHLKGKTEGQQQFALSLAGPGVKATNGWAAPQLVLREASKQRGTLVIVPEQGMRLQVANREGITQLDPQKSGIRQKGVLAFRILQTPWNLTLDLEQVEPWIQVTGLQHVTVNEAQIKVVANLQYQIENTGLKSLRVLLPTNAASVHFQGDQVADFLPVPNLVTNGLQGWEIKLHRRFIGAYLLQVSYQTVMAERATEAVLRGVQALDVNLQRGFVTIQAAGRLQVSADSAPNTLQPTEWQSIPRALQQDLPAAAANLAYRLVEPAFALTLKLDRHEAAKLLPAHVENISLSSVISDDGVMLTQVRVELLPGDKRLLELTLPKDAKFWFAFVNQNGVWPWRSGDRILIPLEQQSRGGKSLPVEIFYTCQIGRAGRGALALELVAPKFDLPLENITWKVHLNDHWQVKDWRGSFQLQENQVLPVSAAADAKVYLEEQANTQRAKTQEAEQMLSMGNSLLERGDPQQARRAFQAAYGLSQGDDAFNEDARVQLNNLKLQQALVGLNVRQAANGGDPASLGARFHDLRGRKDVAYTQQDAKDIINRNTADENSAFMKLAARLIQQQDAAVSSPAAIRASLPEQGRVLTFRRAVAVDSWADLKIGIDTRAVKTTSWMARAVILGATLIALGALALLGRTFQH